jgi:ssDNA-binding Zn-finger/Zn-ribbon topoisomerase 1
MLEPFDPERRCPKCGHDTIHTQYSNGRTFSWKGGCYDCPRERDGEHLDRRCERCSYRWSEAVVATVSTA